MVVSLVFVSQSVSDVSNSKIKDVIIESCMSKIYLPNNEANTSNIKSQYLAFGLNDKEIDLIATSTPKQHYYITQPLGKRLIDLNIGEVALAFIGISSDASIKRFNRCYQEDDDTWVVRYLNDCGLSEASHYVQSKLLKGNQA